MLPGVNVPSWALAFIKIVRVIAAGTLPSGSGPWLPEDWRTIVRVVAQ